jgi:hypothetical protein
MATAPRCVFVTYSNQVFEVNREALRAAIQASELFQEVVAHTPASIAALPTARLVQAYTSTYARGWGLWSAKPCVVLDALECRMRDGDVLCYADAGCIYDPRWRSTLAATMADLAAARDYDVVAYELGHIEERWTKADTLAHLGVLGVADVCKTPQIFAAHFFLRKTPATLAIVQAWCRVFVTDAHLVDDSPSVLPNAPWFRQHRHDQSVLSVLLKLHKRRAAAGGLQGVLVRRNDTDDFLNVDGCKAPIQARRWRGRGVALHEVVRSVQRAQPLWIVVAAIILLLLWSVRTRSRG